MNPDIVGRFKYPFDTFQTASAEAIERGDNVLVTSHTGSGKSTVAEYAIIKAFLENKRVIYTSPIKTLSNQKFSEFKKKFSEFGAQNIGIQTGDVKLNPDAQCMIMTTEILRNMLFHGIDMENLGYVIFDEVHYINDKDRGQVWEECIVKMPDHVVMVMLSATMANPEDFAHWIKTIKPAKDVIISSTLKRPVPLRFSMFVPNPSSFDENSPWDEAVREGHMTLLMDGDNGTFQSQAYQTMVRRYNNFIQHIFDENLKAPKHQSKKQPYDMMSLMNRFLNFLHINMQVPAILFTLSRKKCDKFADRVEVCMVNHEERREIENIFDFYIRKLPNHDQYKQVIQMKQWLIKGVAVHHSGLLPILKEIIEIIFSKGLIKVLFATETFAIGINMPTKTVVFLDVTKHNGTEVRPLLVEEYKQMAGRAGRRGLDKIGHVIYYPIVEPVTMSHMQNMMQGSVKKINSKFATSTQYVLRGLNARTTLHDPSILDVTKNTMMFGEHMSYRNGCQLQCEQLRHKLSIVDEKLNQVDSNHGLRDIYKSVCELKNKANHTKKNQKQLLRQADDIIENLSKLEKRNYETVVKYLAEKEDIQKDLEGFYQDIRDFPNLLQDEVKICVSYLTQKGYIKTDETSLDALYHDHLTVKGIFANEVNQCDETILTETLLQGLFDQDKYDPQALAVMLACFIDDNDRYEDNSEALANIDNDVVKRVLHLVQVCEDLHHEKSKYNIQSIFNINTKYAGAVHDWCDGVHFETICQTYDIFEGNLVRALTKLVNLLDELRKGFEIIQEFDWVTHIDECKKGLQRDVLVTDSIYLTY